MAVVRERIGLVEVWVLVFMNAAGYHGNEWSPRITVCRLLRV
jgi:hypothetical protein